ncbi:SusD/RagB family nutrient-binding outer membrane lipoprotein [Niabella drilacis]|uniref:Starch-binding associating with outer membrane n=1 Tax=Niabella drilacis (strain DSM 25811 / CCM 8410 / CCUG 62505 / LMG 26954 / E90) TaxID=1285928 RepID=A0A1G6PV93_NIADE|nr:SusD/RagB family nutrient-binding outer membrane lipoprotein [Niabella drilacis]SDC83275.1 Starch-binding associating with outer membrane [Niabella drilacis]
MKRIIKSKTILYSILLGSIILSTTSCNKDFGDINKPWDNKVYTPTIPGLYTSIASSMAENGRPLFTSHLYQASQLAASYSASGYRLDDKSSASWYNYYGALIDYNKTMELIEKDSAVARMTNIKAMLKTLISLKTLANTTYYGDMPYSEAGKSYLGAQYYRPVYDKQQDIFSNALKELKWAIDNFSTSTSQMSLGSADVLLQNDLSLWVKFANSVRLRYALILRNKDAAGADAIIADALSKPLLEPAEYISINPAKITGLQIDRSGTFRGNSYIRMGSTIWNAMSSSAATDGSGIYDLRTKIFFEPNKAGQWKPYPQNPPAGTEAETANGVVDGKNNDPYAEARTTTWLAPGNYLYSPLNYYYVADRTIPDLIITGSEVSFLKAEIYNRGIGGVAANPATAKQFYNAGITESVKFWYKVANSSTIWVVNKPAAAPTDGELSTMLANSNVAYSNTVATALTQIYRQSWLAMFHQPYDAWVLQRRTNYGTPFTQLAPTSEVLDLNKLIYPQAEASSNAVNWRAATNGADDKSKKPWFMP